MKRGLFTTTLLVVAGAVFVGCGSSVARSTSSGALVAASTTEPQSCPANSKQLDRPSFDHPLAQAHTYPTLAAASHRLSFEPVVPPALGRAVRFDSNGSGIAVVYGETCARRFVVVEAAGPRLPNGSLATAHKITNSVGSMIAWNQHGITFTVSGPAPSFTMRKAERVARTLASRA